MENNIKNITELTPEQEITLKTKLQEWLEVGRSTHAINRKEAEESITAMYNAIGKQKPLFFWFPSPLQCMLGLAVSKMLKDKSLTNIIDNIEGIFRHKLLSNLRNSLWANLRNNLESNLWNNLERYLLDNLWENLWGNLGDNINANLRHNLRDNLVNNIEDNLRNNLRENLRGNINDHLEYNLRENLWGNLGDNLRENLWGNLGGNLGDNLRDNIVNFKNSLWNNLRGNISDHLEDNLRENLWDNLWENLRNNLGDNINANLRHNLRDNLVNNIEDNLRNNLRENLWGNISDHLEDNLRENLWGNLGDNLRENLKDNLWGNLRDNLRDNLKDNLKDNLRDNLEGNLEGNLADNLWDNLRNSLWANLRNNIWSNLQNNLRDNLKGNLEGNIENNIENNLIDNLDWNYFAGNLWCAWEVFYDFCNEIGVPYSTQDRHMLDMWLTQSRNCHLWWPLEGIVFLSERPVSLSLDNMGRQHCENDASLYYADGYALYNWHGVRVPKWIIENPEQITIEKIFAETNAEIRRVMCERFGFRKFGQALIESGKARLISEQNVWNEPVKYYHYIDNNVTMGFIHVINGTTESDGTKHEFILTVKADNDNAEKAVLSTYPELMQRIESMSNKWYVIKSSIRT